MPWSTTEITPPGEPIGRVLQIEADPSGNLFVLAQQVLPGDPFHSSVRVQRWSASTRSWSPVAELAASAALLAAELGAVLGSHTAELAVASNGDAIVAFPDNDHLRVRLCSFSEAKNAGNQNAWDVNAELFEVREPVFAGGVVLGTNGLSDKLVYGVSAPVDPPRISGYHGQFTLQSGPSGGRWSPRLTSTDVFGVGLDVPAFRSVQGGFFADRSAQVFWMGGGAVYGHGITPTGTATGADLFAYTPSAQEGPFRAVYDPPRDRFLVASVSTIGTEPAVWGRGCWLAAVYQRSATGTRAMNWVGNHLFALPATELSLADIRASDAGSIAVFGEETSSFAAAPWCILYDASDGCWQPLKRFPPEAAGTDYTSTTVQAIDAAFGAHDTLYLAWAQLAPAGPDSFHVYAIEYSATERTWSPVILLETIPLPYAFDSLTVLGGRDARPSVLLSYSYQPAIGPDELRYSLITEG